jgi:hypothetical protein
MTKADRERFARALALMAIALDREPSAERVEVYWKYLRDLGIEEIERAINHLIKNRKYDRFPTIGEIRSLIVQEEDERLELEAHLAWKNANEIVFAGRYETDDPVLDRTILTLYGSWANFGRSSEFNEVADRREFLKIYKLLARQEYRLLEAKVKIARELKGKK